MQVHYDGRRAYIGQESDATKNGEVIMSHSKAYKSLAIRSWTGGAKARRSAPGRTRGADLKLLRCHLLTLCGLTERTVLQERVASLLRAVHAASAVLRARQPIATA